MEIQNQIQHKKSYIHYLSFLKCIGMFAVIGIHVFCTPYSYWSEYFSSVSRFMAYFGTNILRLWAVPVFVMVSGALFLNPEKEIVFKTLFGKYILRMVLVLLIFGTVFALMELVFNEHSFSPKMLFTSLKNVYEGTIWAHMWFLYMIIGLYLVTPLLQKMLKSIDEKLLRYLLLILYIFNFVVPFLNEFTDTKFGVSIPFSSAYLFYYILGYAIHFDRIKIGKKVSTFGVFIGVLWCILAQFLPNCTITSGAGIKYASFFGVFISAGIFSLAKKKCKTSADCIDNILNPLSFGVYVIHALFINFMYKAVHFTPDRYTIWIIWVAVFVITCASSLLFVFIARKIPFVRKYIL